MPLPGICPNVQTSVYREVSQSFADLVSEHSTSHERVGFRDDAERDFFKTPPAVRSDPGEWRARRESLEGRLIILGVTGDYQEVERSRFFLEAGQSRNELAEMLPILLREMDGLGGNHKLCLGTRNKMVLLEQDQNGVSLRYDARIDHGDVMRACYPDLNIHLAEAIIRLLSGSATRLVGVR